MMKKDYKRNKKTHLALCQCPQTAWVIKTTKFLPAIDTPKKKLRTRNDYVQPDAGRGYQGDTRGLVGIRWWCTKDRSDFQKGVEVLSKRRTEWKRKWGYSAGKMKQRNHFRNVNFRPKLRIDLAWLHESVGFFAVVRSDSGMGSIPVILIVLVGSNRSHDVTRGPRPFSWRGIDESTWCLNILI